jgi:cytoskeletal protein CcmA (bactofilin family)
MKTFFFVALLLTLQQAFASDYQYGSTVTVDNPVYQDLYVTGGNVIINAPVYGDLIVAGGTVHINDSIMHDIMLAGGSVIINGYVGDDIRCTGGTITIAGNVAGDLIVAAGSVHIKENASVESLVSTGGQIVVDGTVRNCATSAAGNFTLNGSIQKDADLRGGKININGTIAGKAILAASRGINFGSGARIERSITYWLPLEKPLQVPPSVSDKTPVYDALLSITHSRWYFLGTSTFLGFLWYLGMAYIMIMLIQYLFSSTFSKAGRSLHSNPGTSAVLGICYFISVPVAIVFFIITIIGVPVAVILMIFYLLLLLLAAVISSIVIVNWVSFLSNRSWGYWRMTGMALFTFVLLKIISFTPYFGWLVMFLLAVVCFGAIITNVKFKSPVRAA